MASVQALLVELQSAAAVVGTLIEGEFGLSASGLSPESVSRLNEALEDMRRRFAHLQRAIEALQALQVDGYPDIPPRFTDVSVIEEMRKHLAAMEAAFTQFKGEVNVTMSFGEPLPQ